MSLLCAWYVRGIHPPTWLQEGQGPAWAIIHVSLHLAKMLSGYLWDELLQRRRQPGKKTCKEECDQCYENLEYKVLCEPRKIQQLILPW